MILIDGTAHFVDLSVLIQVPGQYQLQVCTQGIKLNEKETKRKRKGNEKEPNRNQIGTKKQKGMKGCKREERDERRVVLID